MILAAVAVLVVPLAAAAGKSGSSQQAADYTARWLDTQEKLTALAAAPMGPHGPELTRDGTYITKDLQQQADNQPAKLVRVIIQGAPGVDVQKALRGVVGPGVDLKNLDLVNGAAVDIKAGKLNDLLKLRRA